MDRDVTPEERAKLLSYSLRRVSQADEIQLIADEIRAAEKRGRYAAPTKAVSEFIDHMKRPLPTCEHTLGDLIGGAGAVTTCAMCVRERNQERERRRAVLCNELGCPKRGRPMGEHTGDDHK